MAPFVNYGFSQRHCANNTAVNAIPGRPGIPGMAFPDSRFPGTKKRVRESTLLTMEQWGGINMFETTSSREAGFSRGKGMDRKTDRLEQHLRLAPVYRMNLYANLH